MKKNLLLVVSGAIICVLLLLVMFIENGNSRKVVIKNKTDRDIDRIYVSMVDDDIMDLYLLVDDKLPAKSTLKQSFDETMVFNPLNPGQVFAQIEFKDAEPVIVLEGMFSSMFKGKIELVLTEENGQYILTENASSGLFGSDNNVLLDNFKFALDLETGTYEDIEEE